MKYSFIQPDVAGGWGENTRADTTVHPPHVRKLHYEFEDWSGDVILESFPCYIVTDQARKALDGLGATGISYDHVEVTKSIGFEALHPAGRRLPDFLWLKVTGVAGQDDFGIAPCPDLRLVISSRALEALRPLGITNALIQDYP
jgi:hypothetical protein